MHSCIKSARKLPPQTKVYATKQEKTLSWGQEKKKARNSRVQKNQGALCLGPVTGDKYALKESVKIAMNTYEALLEDWILCINNGWHDSWWSVEYSRI